MTVCEEDCELTDFNKIHNTTINMIKCTCNFKMSITQLSKAKFDPTKLLNNFKDIKNMINISLLKCIKLLFDINNIFNNYANYMLVFLFIFSIISIFIFCCKDYYYIKIIIKTILNENYIYNKMNNNIITEKGKGQKNQYNNYNKFEKNNSKKYWFIIGPMMNFLKNKKSSSKFGKNKTNIIKIEKSNIRKTYKNNNQKRATRKKNRTIKNKVESKIDRNSKASLFEYKDATKTTLNTYNKIRKFRYNDNEMNLLDYKEAKINDKRTFMQYYFSLLKTKHLLINSFFYFQDYNSSIIKIYIFFFNFLIECTISAMFYTEDALHKIFIEAGTFDIIYQIPQMLYSYLLSLLITNLISYLGLYEDNILNIKNSKYIFNKENIDQIRKSIKIKISLFFIITYILLFTFWIYVGCFCAVYKNTQIHLLIEVIWSFSLSLFAPLFTYFIPGIFRIPSLKYGQKSNRPILFKFSKFLQYIF